MDQVKVFKDCLPQSLFGLFLNTLPQMLESLRKKENKSNQS